jgi:hypothetical protein
MTNIHLQSANFIHFSQLRTLRFFPSLAFAPRSGFQISIFSYLSPLQLSMRPSVQLAVCTLVGLAASPVALSLPIQ